MVERNTKRLSLNWNGRRRDAGADAVFDWCHVGYADKDNMIIGDRKLVLVLGRAAGKMETRLYVSCILQKTSQPCVLLPSFTE